MMTDHDAIEAARLGRRVVTGQSMHTRHEPGNCRGLSHRWRVIASDDVAHVVECRECGRQKLLMSADEVRA